MKSVCVFLSSSIGTPAQQHAIDALAHALVTRGWGLVYGGASVGLMGRLADAVLAQGGAVTGVMPAALVNREVAHKALTQQLIVPDMHTRKAKMAELADGFVVAPGGFGTIEEAFEILTARQIGTLRKPIVFLDVDDFWQPLETFLHHAVSAQVLRPANLALWQRVASPAAALAHLADAFTNEVALAAGSVC